MPEPRWREIALYLADCLAATAEYETSLASVSKSRKQRHRQICRRAVELLKGEHPFSDGRSLESVLDRLEQASREDEEEAKKAASHAVSISRPTPAPGVIVEIPFNETPRSVWPPGSVWYETPPDSRVLRVVGIKGLSREAICTLRIGGGPNLCSPNKPKLPLFEGSVMRLPTHPILLSPNVAFLSVIPEQMREGDAPALLAVGLDTQVHSEMTDVE